MTKENNTVFNSHPFVSIEKVFSPIKGEVKELSQVNDPVFSTEILGKGLAILPQEGKVVSPITGSVTNIYKTKHAISITSVYGTEILIHVGLKTVKLGGKYSTSYVSNCDFIDIGEPLITFDLDLIKAEGYDLITPLIIINPDCY